ncbi:MAG: GTP-binding protein [Lachnospiraceae bacterium]|jgi:G3E family GTPase|nr:GTP-binding protein [Lachnospiraceae bacterium]MCI1453342.1 GTP-binding protein [Lachnospiraceae bacterium]
MAETKVDIISGFLGAGKTTLIRKLIKDALAGTKVVLIENEFGEIGIDGGFLKESGIQIREMNSGCICCSLVGDFNASLKQVCATYAPERILIEPSGVGKLDDVMRAIEKTAEEVPGMKLNSAVTVVDCTKAKLYLKNFGEFFTNQIENAGTIVLTRTDKASQEKIDEAVALIREHNKKATIITTPVAELDGKEILDTIEGRSDLQAEILKEVMAADEEHHHHHHHHDEHGEHVTDEDGNTVYHVHHDDDDDEDEEHEHHHDHDHDHDHEEHHHDHDHEGHDHDHDHDADEVFESWGMETPNKYSMDEVKGLLEKLDDSDTYGVILRSKGMLPQTDGTWVHFDYVPGEPQVRTGAADVTGKICVIGSHLNEENLEKLFKKAKN